MIAQGKREARRPGYK